jgi:hypothetical protein
MLHVVEHAHRDPILPAGALGACDLGMIQSIMMHSPDSEECHKKFRDDHHNDVIDQKVDLEVKHDRGEGGG